MHRSAYERMAAQEGAHWWFAARRDVIATLISRRVKPPPGARLLEAGCGTGGNLAMLGEFGDLDAFEFDEGARAVAASRSGREIPSGALPDAIPFGDRRYDMIGIFDVLEHVENDAPALAALAGRLAPGGRIVLTVPAFPALWSEHDETHHHFRRYTSPSLARVAEQAGLRVVADGYFNTFLFPAVYGVRALKRVLGRKTPDDTMPGRFANAVLYRVFAAERHLVGRIRMPFGVSLFAVLERAE